MAQAEQVVAQRAVVATVGNVLSDAVHYAAWLLRNLQRLGQIGERLRLFVGYQAVESREPAGYGVDEQPILFREVLAIDDA